MAKKTKDATIIVKPRILREPPAREFAQELPPLPHVDLDLLRNKEITLDVFHRGVDLNNKGRAIQNSTYPWKYLVSGDKYPTGTAAYQVDLSDVSCGCKWYEITGSPCKHIVAALLDYIEKQE